MSEGMQTVRDCCPHGVPFRWPEWCVECESEETDAPDNENKVTNVNYYGLAGGTRCHMWGHAQGQSPEVIGQHEAVTPPASAHHFQEMPVRYRMMFGVGKPTSGYPHREQTAMRRELTRGKARPIFRPLSNTAKA